MKSVRDQAPGSAENRYRLPRGGLPSIDAATARRLWGSWQTPEKARWDDPVRGTAEHELQRAFPSIEYVGKMVQSLRESWPISEKQLNDIANHHGMALEGSGFIVPAGDGSFSLTAEGVRRERALRSALGESRVRLLYSELEAFFRQAR